MEAQALVLLLLSLCLCGKSLSLTDGDLKLELASVVFRHGDRSPVRTFPTDPYTEDDWPQGYGQLSKIGMQQEYHLGGLLKARYVIPGACDGLICDNYTRVQVRIRSTDYDRTLMSGESQLASFFYPGADQMFNDSLPWQPIPIHTIPTINDTLLRPLDNCPIYDQLQDHDMHNDKEYIAMVETNKEFFAQLSKDSGMTVTLENCWQVFDTVKIEHDSPDHTEPSWATEDVRNKLQEISDFTMNFMFKTTQKRRLSAGTWIGKVLSDMKGKANSAGNKTLEDMKLFLYSAHDTTVCAMTNGLNVTNDKQPGYTTAFAVELWSNMTSGEYFVQQLRRDGPDSDTFDVLNASYCKNPTLCTLEEFETYANMMIPSDLAKECAIPSDTPTSSPQDLDQQNKQLRIAVIGLGSALGVVLILTFVLLVLLVSMCRQKNAKNQRIYSALNADNT